MPSATGTSMPMRACAQVAPGAKRRRAGSENSSTGSVSSQEAQRSRAATSAVMSPGPARYAGAAYIITCIMQKPATSQRQSSMRCAVPARRGASLVAGRPAAVAGAAQGGQPVRGPALLRQPDDTGGGGDAVDFDRAHARQRRERLFDRQGTARAVHAVDAEVGLPLALAAGDLAAEVFPGLALVQRGVLRPRWRPPRRTGAGSQFACGKAKGAATGRA